eukprot:6421343-Karenia_brevis.AAC.1
MDSPLGPAKDYDEMSCEMDDWGGYTMPPPKRAKMVPKQRNANMMDVDTPEAGTGSPSSKVARSTPPEPTEAPLPKRQRT